ncbi:uncharacterized protein [Coffea arabica]|uniref:Uncharacterized protein n=1 Tax=Coffea arabica TaxID=13443 RepID=A0A6P6XEC9_COFAR|nr:uncharacterized protein LOC113742430 [Coffea arabica]
MAIGSIFPLLSFHSSSPPHPTGPQSSLSVSASQPHGPHPTVRGFAAAATHNLPLRLYLSAARPTPHSHKLCRRRYPQPPSPSLPLSRTARTPQPEASPPLPTARGFAATHSRNNKTQPEASPPLPTVRGFATHAATHNLPKDAAIAFSKKQQKLIQTPRNLVDEVWISRSPLELNPVAVHPPQFSGRSVADKLKDLRENLVQEKVRGILITTLDEVTKEKVMEAIERHILGEAVLMANF